MQDKKNWVIVALVLFCLGLWMHESKPARPVLRFLGGIIKTAVWVAPLLLDDHPAPETIQATEPPKLYGAEPPRPRDENGYAIIDHGEHW